MVLADGRHDWRGRSGNSRAGRRLDSWTSGYSQSIVRSGLPSCRGVTTYGLFSQSAALVGTMVLCWMIARVTEHPLNSTAPPTAPTTATTARATPPAATRAGTLDSVSSSGTSASSSSHRNGVDTCPPTRDRTDHAPVRRPAERWTRAGHGAGARRAAVRGVPHRVRGGAAGVPQCDGAGTNAPAGVL